MSVTHKRRFMVYLDPGEWAYLKQYQEAHGTKVTEIVRRAVKEYAERHPVPDKQPEPETRRC